MFKEKQANRGITLIALVITIIVLLILAGVTIATLTGENGILSRASQSQTATDIADTEEQIKIELMSRASQNDSGTYTVEDVKEVAKNITGNDVDEDAQTVLTKKGNTVDLAEIIAGASNGSGTGGSIEVGQLAPSQGTINGEPGTAQNPTIPAGYIPINEGDAVWDGASGPAYDEGLVITDAVDNGNQWVWVPVSDPSVMYEENAEGVALSGSTGVTTSKYSASRGLPGSSSWREPDLVVGSGGTEYDAVVSNVTQAGFSDTADMAQTMVNEYSTMIESIETYGGFYIGRYELTADGEKPGAVLTNTNWYELYAKCKELAKSDSNTTTRMIWGAQWDVACNWLADNGYNIEDSTSWGNYSNNTATGHGTKQNTGYSEYWKANNIYDLAGNCWEWTQEAGSASRRVSRGGSYNDFGSNAPVTYRFSYSPTNDSYSNLRFSLHFNIEPLTPEGDAL